jgi:hypothetical protein
MRQRESECQSSLSQSNCNTNKNMSDHERKYIEGFFKAIETNLTGYQHSSFSYLALKKGDAFELSQGRLALQGVPTPIPSGCFQSENIKAGIVRLSEMNLSSVKGTKAKLVIVIADGLATENASLGYRVFDRNRVTKRGLLSGSELKWEKIENVQRGLGEVEVPAGVGINI